MDTQSDSPSSVTASDGTCHRAEMIIAACGEILAAELAASRGREAQIQAAIQRLRTAAR